MGGGGRRNRFQIGSPLKIILTTPTPPICKKDAPKICHTMGVYGIKVGKNQGLSTENMAYGPKNMAYDPPPLLCHMNRFYGGCGWSLICGSPRVSDHGLTGDRVLADMAGCNTRLLSAPAPNQFGAPETSNLGETQSTTLFGVPLFL